MKTFTSILVIALLVSNSFATVTTVSNNANSPGQYTNLQTAIDNAPNGDTLYVHGSPTSYGAVHLNRSLTLIGTGYNPQKDNPLVSEIATLYFDSVPGIKGCSNSTVMGFYISSSMVDGTGSYPFNNMLISLNRINQINLAPTSATGMIIKHNAIHSLYQLNRFTNLILRNNIIYNYVSIFQNCNSVLITNNLFFYNSQTNAVLQDFSTIANNIFVGTHPNTSFSTFNNNLIFATSNDVLPYGNNTGSGNFNAVAPLFVNVPDYNNINFAYNYRLTTTSPGHNGGTDGSDIGPFGGLDPLPDLTGTPPVPQIKVFNINNAVVSPSTPLNIYVKAKKQ